MRISSRGCCSVLALGMLTAGAQAHAASAFDPDGQYMFGDWGGVRTNLADQGVTFKLKYISESTYNLHGGYDHDNTARYSDQWTAGANFDLDQLLGIPDAQFQVTFTDRNGDDLTTDRLTNPADGNISSVQEVYGRGNVVRLTQFWFKQKLFNGRFSYKLGRIPVGDDFAVYNSQFQNLYLGSGEPGNQNGGIWYNWPVSQWAAVGRFNTTPNTYAQLGFFNLNPENTDPDRHLDIYHDSGTTGTLIPAEIGWTPKLGSEGLPGVYRFGGYYSTADSTDYSVDYGPGDEDRTKGERYGLYYVVQQQIATRDGNVDRGPSVFSMGAWNDDDTSFIERYVSAGVTYKGLFDARPKDQIGWGLAYAKVNDDYNSYNRRSATLSGVTDPGSMPSQGEEYDSELYYSVHLTNWFKIRPNLQYVIHPGGNSDTDNAWVAGASVLATF